MELKLIVIRTDNPQRLSDFYSLLGLVFDYHKHGNSPYHYGTTIGETVVEIYPLTKSQNTPDKSLRLGFTIDHFDEVIEKLKSLNTVFSSEPSQTDFGFIAVIEDPDGRKIELYKK